MAGNPLSVRAGIALLEVLEQNGVYERLDQLGKRLEDGLLELIDKHNITATINRVYGSLTLYFTDEKSHIMSKLRIQMEKHLLSSLN